MVGLNLGSFSEICINCLSHHSTRKYPLLCLEQFFKAISVGDSTSTSRELAMFLDPHFILIKQAYFPQQLIPGNNHPVLTMRLGCLATFNGQG